MTDLPIKASVILVEDFVRIADLTIVSPSLPLTFFS